MGKIDDLRPSLLGGFAVLILDLCGDILAECRGRGRVGQSGGKSATVLLNAAGAQPEKAKGLERALPREKLLLRHLIAATRLLECDYAAGHRCHDLCGEPPTSGSSGMGARSWTGFGPLPANLYSVPHYEPEGPKHPPPSGDSPLTQPRKSAGSRTARDAVRADQRGYCGLKTCDRRPSRQTKHVEAGVRAGRGYSHASRLWVSNLPRQAVARRADIRSFRLL